MKLIPKISQTRYSESRFGIVAGVTGYPSDPQATAQAVADSLPSNGASGKKPVIEYRHPDYISEEESVTLYREAWVGGKAFADKYLVQLSKREDPLSLAERKTVTYVPAISKGCVVEIKNAISMRMSEITRKNGTKTYDSATKGDKWGVDKCGSTMDSFMVKHVIPELLAMGKVGVYIDRPSLPDNFTQLDTIDKRPYIYIFKREDILAWVHDESSEPNQFSVLLLRENYLRKDLDTGLPIAWEYRYRFLKKTDTGVEVTFYNHLGDQIDRDGNKTTNIYPIKLKVMPFVVFEISESLLTDTAMYQVCLMNLASSDISYALKSNFPFYTEQYDPKAEPGFYKTGVNPIDKLSRDAANVNFSPRNLPGQNTKDEIEIGNMHGRRHPVGTITPAFVHPSPEPLLASMKKQDQLKGEIRTILTLWLSNVTAGSLDLNIQDNKQGLESGLNNIGMELEHGERSIMSIWALYEGQNNSGTVSYPTTYYVKTDEERRQEAKEINELKSAIPSVTYQKETAKQSVLALFKGKLSADILNKIAKEIDNAQTMTCNVEEITADIQNGLVGLDLASVARGYPPGQTAIAKIEQSERLAMVQAAQSSEGKLKNPGSRGVSDASVNPKLDAKTEKASTTVDPIKPPNQRGDGK